MQKQNVVSIDYFENPIRFADLINGYIYHGRELIQPEDISEINRTVARIDKEKGTVRTQVITADVVCKVAHEGMRVALVALENQSDIHYAMPVRVMNVESSGYHQQWRRIAKKHQQKKDLRGAEFLSGFSKEDKLIPIITIVVYFGKESWDAPLSIKEMMELGSYPSEFRNLIEDYHIHLLEVRKYENLEKFHTDIKYVFGFLQNEGSKDTLTEYVHANEKAFEDLSEDAYDMISVMSHSEELQYLKKDLGEGGCNMCQAIKEMIEDGRQEGMAIAIKNLMHNLKWTAEQAMEALGIPQEERGKYLQLIEVK